jgi:hypothetical protein
MVRPAAKIPRANSARGSRWMGEYRSTGVNGDGPLNSGAQRQNSWPYCEPGRRMILRFSQKLGSRLQTGSLKPSSLDESPVADWTCHVFFCHRTPYILVSNTAALYSILLYAKGIPHDGIFISRFITALRDFMGADGLAFAYERFIAPHTGVIRFASAFSRSVTGSMNELSDYAKVILTDEEISPFHLGFRLNDLLLSAAATDESRVFGKPRDAFRALIADSRTQ